MNNKKASEDENLMPELRDIVNRIIAFNRLHPQGAFIYNFIGFKKDTNLNNICEDCGELHEVYDENKSTGGAFGSIEDVRYLLNMLRDVVEDTKDEDGWVDV